MEERRPGPSSRAVSPSQDELLSGWEGPGGAGGKGMDVPSQGPALLRDLSAFCLGLWLVLNPSDLGQAWSCSGGSRGGEKPFPALEAERKGDPLPDPSNGGTELTLSAQLRVVWGAENPLWGTLCPKASVQRGDERMQQRGGRYPHRTLVELHIMCPSWSA